MQRHFASEDEIRFHTVNVDVNGAIQALNEGKGWEVARELSPPPAGARRDASCTPPSSLTSARAPTSSSTT